MPNPFVSLKRLFLGTPAQRPSGEARRVEKDFMTYDLTSDARF